MAGQPKRRAMIEALESLRSDYFEADPVPTHLDYVACYLEDGHTLNDLADTIAAHTNLTVYRGWIGSYLRDTFGIEAVDARLNNARAYASHCMAEQALSIVDEPAETMVEVSRATSRSRARQWTAERWNPQQYGNRSQTTVNVSVTSLHLESLRSIATTPIVVPVVTVAPPDAQQALPIMTE